MTKAQKRTLLKALRSGEYQQARFALYKGDNRTGNPKMCCLGVACDVLLDGEWVPAGAGNDFAFVLDGEPVNLNNTGHPSVAGRDILGLTAGDVLNLARINDTSVNYEHAIQYIEENL